MRRKKVRNSVLKAINNNDFSQFKEEYLCKSAVKSLEWWNSLPEATRAKILENLIPDDGIYSIK